VSGLPFPWRAAAAWAAVAAITAGAVLIGGHAAQPTPFRSASPTGDRDEYSFLGRSADGSPSRWDPCTPIEYQVDLAGKPASSLADIRRAVELTASASGLEFAFAGLVEGTSPGRIATARRFVTPRVDGTLGWSPVLITFAPEEVIGAIGGDEDVVALAFTVASVHDRDQIVSGMIVVNADAILTPGFGSIRALGPVVQHELGHVVGLGHADQPFQLMYPTAVVTRWNDGDRTGLRLLGSGPCLVEPVPEPGAAILL
jgi:hypothetical protein